MLSQKIQRILTRMVQISCLVSGILLFGCRMMSIATPTADMVTAAPVTAPTSPVTAQPIVVPTATLGIIEMGKHWRATILR
jgi:hypothetical protein